MLRKGTQRLCPSRTSMLWEISQKQLQYNMTWLMGEIPFNILLFSEKAMYYMVDRKSLLVHPDRNHQSKSPSRVD